MGMRFVIIGASGLIGSAVEAAARKAGHEVVGTYATRPREGLRRFDVTKENLLDVVPDLRADDRVLLMSAAIDHTMYSRNMFVGYFRSVDVVSTAGGRRRK